MPLRARHVSKELLRILPSGQRELPAAILLLLELDFQVSEDEEDDEEEDENE